MIVDYIDVHRDQFGVEPICEVLQVAPSTYHAHRSRAPSARSISDAATSVAIGVVHADNYGVYGARKVHAELNRAGHRVARCTVERLMRTAGLQGITRAKGPRTTVPGLGPDHRPDLVDREFTAAAPNQLWVADITYVRTFAGWVYVAFVIDVFSRRVVGWQCSTSLRTDLALDALEMGIWARERTGRTSPTSSITAIEAFKVNLTRRHKTSLAEVLMGGPAGWMKQLSSWAFTNKIRSSGMMPSFDSIGDGLDNAMMGSFWSSMQIEMLNRKRRHSQLGYRTPIEFALTYDNPLIPAWTPDLNG